jgi:hypothetical protein
MNTRTTANSRFSFLKVAKAAFFKCAEMCHRQAYLPSRAQIVINRQKGLFFLQSRATIAQ